ncbi:MAG: protein translocase subunit SecD [Pseudomonadota bacterium]
MLDFPRWKVMSILGVCLLGLLFALPNVVPQKILADWPAFLPTRQVNLGLDLQGGSHLLLEVDTASVIQQRLDLLKASVRNAFREARTAKGERILYFDLSSQDQTVSFRVRDPDNLEQVLEMMRDLAQPVGQNLLTGTFSGQRDLEVSSEGADRLVLSLTDEGIEERKQQAVQQSIEVVRRRIDELGTREPTIQIQGRDRIVVQVPGFNDPAQLKEVLGRTAQMTFHMVAEEVSPQDIERNRLPIGTRAYPMADQPELKLALREPPQLSGDRLKDARAAYDQNGQPAVAFTMDATGAAVFSKITRENIGRRFAIVLDGEIVTAPVIQGVIPSGSGQITGSFTVAEANNLAIILKSGALPAKLTILEERTVGPDLGADAVEAGEIAGILGMAFVVFFMVAVYGRFGLIANLALAANVILLLAAMSMLQATLTLPGIAGIVLTVGMAVDANVLVFERMREEVRKGRTPIAAAQAGYEQAMSTIMDANITTLIAAALMFQFGSGPVKGFAVTLTLGIVTSVFSAIMITRMIITLWLRRARPAKLPLDGFKWFRVVPDETHIRFMKTRHVCLALSVVMIIASFVYAGVHGLNFGIDFRGGIMMEVETKAPADLAATRSAVGGLGLGEVAIQEFGSPNDILIRIERQSEGAQDAAIKTVDDALATVYGADYEVRRTEVVGPKVSGELVEKGTMAIVFAIIAIMIYIWFRFEWQFGLGAVASLVHDVALTVGFFSVTGLEFNLSIIAAILTIIGYSLNDTVVVFDRIRENIRIYRKLSMLELIDLSINDTLSRTFMTSFTTLLALFGLFFFGGEVIRGFTAAMIWGIFIGTYSSIFIAAPLLNWLNVKRESFIPAEVRKAGL